MTLQHVETKQEAAAFHAAVLANPLARKRLARHALAAVREQGLRYGDEDRLDFPAERDGIRVELNGDPLVWVPYAAVLDESARC